RQLPRFTRVTIAAVIVIILGSSEQARVEGWAYEATQGVPDAPQCRDGAVGERRRDGGRRPTAGWPWAPSSASRNAERSAVRTRCAPTARKLAARRSAQPTRCAPTARELAARRSDLRTGGDAVRLDARGLGAVEVADAMHAQGVGGAVEAGRGTGGDDDQIVLLQALLLAQQLIDHADHRVGVLLHRHQVRLDAPGHRQLAGDLGVRGQREQRDRKSTRLNSSHVSISYAVF